MGDLRKDFEKKCGGNLDEHYKHNQYCGKNAPGYGIVIPNYFTFILNPDILKQSETDEIVDKALGENKNWKEREVFDLIPKKYGICYPVKTNRYGFIHPHLIWIRHSQRLHNNIVEKIQDTIITRLSSDLANAYEKLYLKK
jgi:hypothetical protein